MLVIIGMNKIWSPIFHMVSKIEKGIRQTNKKSIKFGTL